MLPQVIPAPQSLSALTQEPLVLPQSALTELALAFHDWAPGASARLTSFAQTDGDTSPSGSSAPAVSATQDSELAAQGFTLTASNAELIVTAADPNGALYAVNALIQALRTDGVTEFQAASTPKYEFRGFMLDITRHFFGVSEIKTAIDLASQYNLNRLHLHLSDDQGWRVEIEGRPEFTELASANDADGGPGGYLTFAQYDEVQDYAQLYGMTVVPEIDLPGHTHAMQVAYPQTSPDGKPREPYAGIEVGFSYLNLEGEETWQILEDVVASLAKHTRGTYLHMGGDEVLKVERPDYEKFMSRLGKLVTKYGKKLTLWHEGAGSELPQGTQLQYWTSQFNQENLAKTFDTPGIQYIASPAKHAYLDLKPVEDFPLGLTWAGLVNLETAFSWEPASAIPVPAHLITGVETCLWTETIRTLDDITTMILPRLPAVASVAWGSTGTFEQFAQALPSHAKVWQDQGLAFYRDPAVSWNETK